MKIRTVFNLPDNFDLTQKQDILSKKYKYNPEHSKKRSVTFFDTFDWRIYNAGLVLFNSGRRFYLRPIETDTIIAEAGYQKRPVFIWDFTSGNLKERLIAILGVRALMVKCVATFVEENGTILNKDEKIVSKVLIREVISKKMAKPSAEYHTLKLFPLRGYFKDARIIVNKINTFTVKDPVRDPFQFIVDVYGIKPGEYSSKINIRLQRKVPAQVGIKSILKFLLQVIRQNEDGIKRDIDTEFLHDFRVAIRRARAALSQLSVVFPPSILQKFKKDFSYIGKMSNHLRDLDVYLLNESNYKRMVPSRMGKDITILFDQLRRERKTAHRQFVKVLNSKRYKSILSTWQTYLNSNTVDNGDSSPDAKRPIIKIAKPIIYTQLNLILKLGSEIDENTEDEKVHALRLECKKLRYLLEFFISLFPKRKIEKFINHLKILQDNLGNFNDYSVQQESLQNYLMQMSTASAKGKQAIAAVGALIGVLYDRQLQTRQEFADRYSQFASKENIALAIKLFHN